MSILTAVLPDVENDVKIPLMRVSLRVPFTDGLPFTGGFPVLDSLK